MAGAQGVGSGAAGSARHGRVASNAARMLVFGVAALLLGLAATMAGACVAYWHSVALPDVPGPLNPAEPDRLSLSLVLLGSVTTLLGGFSISRSQDM